MQEYIRDYIALRSLYTGGAWLSSCLLYTSMPLNEIIYDFFDQLKSRTKGYASFDYEFKEYKKSELVKLDIHVNGEPVDALSFIVHKDNSYERGRKTVSYTHLLNQNN